MALVRSFDAKFATRSALSFLPSLFRFPALVWANRFMVQNFLRRDLMSRVNGSVLGLGWMLVRPLCMFALYYAVFGLVLGPRASDGGPDPSYAFFLFLGYQAYRLIGVTEGLEMAATELPTSILVWPVLFGAVLAAIHSLLRVVDRLTGAPMAPTRSFVE